MDRNGPGLDITPLPTINENPDPESVPDSDPKYQSDFPDDYTDLFETLPLHNSHPPSSQISPDFDFELADTIPQMPSTPLPPSPIPGSEISNDDEPSELFQSQEDVAELPSFPPSSHVPSSEDENIIKTIPENEIIKILDHAWYNNKVHYKILFKNKKLPQRYFKGPWVPQRFIDEYLNSMKEDLPYKKFYPPKIYKV